MFTQFKRTAVVVICLAALSIGTVFAAEDPVFTGRGDFAINGYDSVAYHLDMKPVKGDSDITTEWNGAVWRFKSAENRDLFASDPERWAPKYGGYCAWAVSHNYTAKTDPDAWSIVDDRLYLNFNKRIQRKWSKDIPHHIERADSNWPAVLSN